MEVTLDGLRHWYKRYVQKWGMVVIGLENGSTSRTERYIQSGNRLLRKIVDKMETVESTDTLRDLQIMSNHLQLLLRHAQRDLAAAAPAADAAGAYMGEQKYLEQKRRKQEEARRRAALKSLK